MAGAPTLGDVRAGNRRVDVAWTAPGQDGGSAITRYGVRVYAGTGATPVLTVDVPATDTSATVPGLQNGTGYTVDVVAVNGVGESIPSARSALVTPTASATATAPARVEGVSVRRGNASLTVGWKAPADGGSAVTAYVVTVHLGRAGKAVTTLTVRAPALKVLVRGLKNGTGYTVDVQARNAVGTGPASLRSAVVVPATTPGAPVITKVRPAGPGGKLTAALTWRAPRSDGGAAVVAYRVVALRLSATGRVIGRTTVTVRSAKVRSLGLRLRAGTYRFTVQAVNAVGAGAASRPSAAVRAR